MQGYNLIVVYNESFDKILMCRRRKNPFKGLANFVGGKIEAGEESLHAAYRELEEETSITSEDITLLKLMDMNYYFSALYLEVYMGKLNKPVTLAGDENELFWADMNDNFFDTTKYAGYGNIGHILAEAALYKKNLMPQG